MQGEGIEMSLKSDPNAARRFGVRRFDASEYLRDEVEFAAYLKAAAAEEDPRVLAAALGDVARARGTSVEAPKK
jgi:probable addiction module antidote protein